MEPRNVFTCEMRELDISVHPSSCCKNFRSLNDFDQSMSNAILTKCHLTVANIAVERSCKRPGSKAPTKNQPPSGATRGASLIASSIKVRCDYHRAGCGDPVRHALSAVKGTRGFCRVNVRHGISRVRNGRRFALGIIFHGAKLVF